MTTPPMDCQELVELVTAYLEGALNDQTRDRFEHHLQACDGCANYLQQFRMTVSTLGQIPDESLDPALRDRLLTAFRHWR
jgi:anti-sigma factor RsiW